MAVIDICYVQNVLCYGLLFYIVVRKKCLQKKHKMYIRILYTRVLWTFQNTYSASLL